MKLTKQEENRILELLQSDPEAGLKLAMNHFGGTVKWIAATILGPDARQDVEECVAETFVRLWRNSRRFRDRGLSDTGDIGWNDGEAEEAVCGGSLYSYTCGIARHVAIDMMRRQPKNQVSLDTGAEMRSSAGKSAGEANRNERSEDDSLWNADPDFAEQLVRKENRRILWETVDQLPPPDREIFLMRYWLELRVKEIAARLGLTEKQVENRLYRGRLALRKTLEERGIIR